MSRRWHYWPKLLIRNLYGLSVLAVLLFGGGSLFLKSVFTPRPNVKGAGIGLLLIAIPIVWFLWVRRRDIRNANKLLFNINPLKLSFTADGIHTMEKSGSTNFTPWSNFDGFREGQTVILLREAATSEYRVIPKDTASIAAVEEIQSAIRSYLPQLD